MSISTAPDSGSTRPRSPWQLLVVVLLLLGSLIIVSTNAAAPEARAAALTVTATADAAWAPFSPNPAYTVSGTTVNGGVGSIRIFSTFGSGDYGFQGYGACPSWLTVSLGGSNAECYTSGTQIVIRRQDLQEIPASTSFSVTVAATAQITPTDLNTFRNMTVQTCAATDQWCSTVIDSGTTRLVWPITVVFDGNGADGGSMPDQTSSGPAALSANAFTRAGFTFGGWAAFAGGPQVYADGATYPFDGQFPTTLVARWLAPSHTVTFHANGGEGVMAPQTASTSTALSPNLFTRAGFDFVGWKLDTNPGAPDYVNSAPYNFSASIDLYAIWQQQAPTTYTVTFNSNGGSPVPSDTFTQGGSFSVFIATTRNGFTFDGWSTVLDDATTRVSFPYSPPQAANITLFALWVAVPAQQDPGSPAAPELLPTEIVEAPQSLVAPPATTVDATPPAQAPTATTVGDSSLITPAVQEQLTASAGDARVLVGGQLVEVSLVQAPAEIRGVAHADRTADQVAELQNLASSMLDQLRSVLGDNTTLPISVRSTPTGAVIVGLANDPLTGEPIDIAVEDVVVVAGGGLVLMASGTGDGRTARIGLDGALEIPQGGHVSVLAGGLTPGAGGEVAVMSTPRVIGGFSVGRSGQVQEQAGLPGDLDLGDHTVVVTVGDDAASLGFRLVPAPAAPDEPVNTASATALPATGIAGGPAGLAFLLVVVGSASVLWSNRRRIAGGHRPPMSR